MTVDIFAITRKLEFLLDTKFVCLGSVDSCVIIKVIFALYIFLQIFEEGELK